LNSSLLKGNFILYLSRLKEIRLFMLLVTIFHGLIPGVLLGGVEVAIQFDGAELVLSADCLLDVVDACV